MTAPAALVSAGTVTAQLLYEIDGPAYPGPDVVAHFDSVALTADGPDRVRISGARGTPPPPTLKVAMNYRGGYRNTMTLVLTGLDIEEKAAWARAELFGLLGGEDRFERTDVRLLRFDQPDAPANEQATAHLRVTVLDPDQRRVGRRVLGRGAGAGPGRLRRLSHDHAAHRGERVRGVLARARPGGRGGADGRAADGSRQVVPHTQHWPRSAGGGRGDADRPAGAAARATGARPGPRRRRVPAGPAGPTRRAPLGLVAGARSGDKGGNANVGLWARDDAGYAWLAAG